MGLHPQTTPRGLWAGNYQVGASGLFFSDYSTTTALLDANTTGLLVAGQVRVSGQKYIGANTTGFIFTAAAAKPSTRSASKLVFITNSTGVNGVALNVTGTTWKFLNVTAILPSS